MFYVALLSISALYLLMTVYYGSEARNAGERHRQRKLFWTACVFGLLTLTSVLHGLNAFIHEPLYLAATHLAWGFSIVLIATIPCRLSFFNRKYVRPFCNLVFIGLGLVNFWLAIKLLR